MDDELDAEGDQENDPAVVVELPDESTGSNSVEFVEIDSPAKAAARRGKAAVSDDHRGGRGYHGRRAVDGGI